MEHALNDAFRYLFIAAVCAGSFGLATQVAKGTENPRHAWLVGILIVGFISFQIGYGSAEGNIPELCEAKAQAAQVGLVPQFVLDQCVSDDHIRTFMKFFLILGVPFGIGTHAGVNRRKTHLLKIASMR
jgi:hypothetical protein